MNDIKLHDIKDLVEVPDYSIYLYYGLIIFAIILVCSLIYLGYMYYKKRNIKTIRKEYIKNLKNIDFSNSKKSAYEITKYASYIAATPREKNMLENLIQTLDKYKYKKIVPNIQDEVKHSLELFMDAIDE